MSGDAGDVAAYDAMLAEFNLNADAAPNYSWMQPLIIKTYETGKLGGDGKPDRCFS